jgi:putative ABC transport system substrate-binding protein
VAGGLVSYGANYEDLNRRAAHYVDKILKGAKPADLPVEQPTKFEMVINRQRREGTSAYHTPHSLLANADRSSTKAPALFLGCDRG